MRKLVSEHCLAWAAVELAYAKIIKSMPAQSKAAVAALLLHHEQLDMHASAAALVVLSEMCPHV